MQNDSGQSLINKKKWKETTFDDIINIRFHQISICLSQFVILYFKKFISCQSIAYHSRSTITKKS